MNTDGHELLYRELSYQVVGAAMEVHSALGCGFLEKVYENALLIELQQRGVRALVQVPIEVHYLGRCVGEYAADIIVEGKIILELKAVSELNDVHRAQLLNYLKASHIRLGLLLNFGKTRLQHERFVL